jgi:hypothetical protein
MECCWRASLLYNNENNKLVCSRQKRKVPKWRLFFINKAGQPEQELA